MNTFFKHAVAATTAAATTIVLFSAVVSLADDDKAKLQAARSLPTTLAVNTVDAGTR